MTPLLRRAVEARRVEQERASLAYYREAYACVGLDFRGPGPLPVCQETLKGPEAPRYRQHGRCECGSPAEVDGPQHGTLVCRRCAALNPRVVAPVPRWEPSELTEAEVWAHVRDFLAGRWGTSDLAALEGLT